jgi:hypothetical protein
MVEADGSGRSAEDEGDVPVVLGLAKWSTGCGTPLQRCGRARWRRSGDDDSEVYSWVQQLTVRLVAENMDAATLSSVSSSVMFH